MFILHVNPLLPQHMFTLVSYPTVSQKKFQDAYEKLNIKDDNVFYTDI